MEINWFEAVLYGIISGLTEYLPVSAQAHQMILLNLFGCDQHNGLLDLFVRLGMLLALVISSGGFMKKLYREYQFNKSTRRRRKREVNMQAVFDIGFTKMACFPILIGFVFYPKTMGWVASVPVVCALMLLNGFILYIPSHLARGNKDSRNMSALDGVIFGICSALSVLPGVSRIGAGCSAAIARGADPQQAYKWSLIVSFPALIVLALFDIYTIFTVGVEGAGIVFVLKCIVSGTFSYFGASIAINLLKTLTIRSGLSGFSYYCWGAALFAFILYLY